jgi:cytochrome c nitrite reductase small subunit
VKSLRPRSWFVFLTAVLLGACLGLGSFTFDYADGLSYLSNNPSACVNCHIMNDQYAGWTKASHHGLATCNDCHLTHSFPRYYIEKGINGWNHSKAFTLEDFHEPIMINESNSRILQGNCLRCHDALVHEIVVGNRSDISSVKCVTCHRQVGHGPTGAGG